MTTWLVQKQTDLNMIVNITLATFAGELSCEHVAATLKEDLSDCTFSVINSISDCNFLWF